MLPICFQFLVGPATTNAPAATDELFLSAGPSDRLLAGRLALFLACWAHAPIRGCSYTRGILLGLVLSATQVHNAASKSSRTGASMWRASIVWVALPKQVIARRVQTPAKNTLVVDAGKRCRRHQRGRAKHLDELAYAAVVFPQIGLTGWWAGLKGSRGAL